MAYRIFHIFTNSSVKEDTQNYKVENKFFEKILLSLGVIKKEDSVKSDLKFQHSVISPSKLQDIIKDQIAHLRVNNLEPFCIFIGSQDYVNICEYADFGIIEKVSYVENIKLLEEVTKTIPLSMNDGEISRKMFEFANLESRGLINRQQKRIPGSLIVSGYTFLSLPLVILPWLSGVFVTPDMSESPPPNTTFI